MVIYEVNLVVEMQVAKAFATWLEEHIREILELPGFVGATLYSRNPADEGLQTTNRVLWTVAYRLSDRESLDRYLQEHAPAMRAKGKEKFGDSFAATRRVLAERRTY